MRLTTRTLAAGAALLMLAACGGPPPPTTTTTTEETTTVAPAGQPMPIPGAPGTVTTETSHTQSNQ